MERSQYRTVDARSDAFSIVKPGELIDIVEVTPLTLQDRRIYNELIGNAWEKIEEPVEHVIEKRRLRGSHNVNDRVGESIERLMGAIVRIRVKVDGKPGTKRIALLGTNREQNTQDGRVYYTFPPDLRAIIRESRVFARLERQVMYLFESKYSLALYELVTKRINLKLHCQEEFSVSELRGLLVVPKGKLLRYADLNRKVFAMALAEVNQLSAFTVWLTPIKSGRAVEKLRLGWSRKSPEELRRAWVDRDQPRVVRRSRLSEIVQADPQSPSDNGSLEHNVK